ncbi:MAG: YciI family protein [Dehalococcoidia bacterium]
MKYAAVIEYIADEEKVQSMRPVHREYLRALIEQGKLAAAGPFVDGSGALIIYEAESPEQAEALLTSDPFHEAGVFATWAIRPWNQVM